MKIQNSHKFRFYKLYVNIYSSTKSGFVYSLITKFVKHINITGPTNIVNLQHRENGKQLAKKNT